MSDDNNHADENKLIAERRTKLALLRAAGNPFPNNFRRGDYAADILAAHDSKADEVLVTEATAVCVAGRMLFKRVMGKASFAKLQDPTGQIQLFLQRDVIGEGLYDAFKGWDIGDILGAHGVLFRDRKSVV